MAARRKHKCLDCLVEHPVKWSGWYFYSPSGQKLERPRCRLCWEHDLVLSTHLKYREKPQVVCESHEQRVDDSVQAFTGTRRKDDGYVYRFES